MTNDTSLLCNFSMDQIDTASEVLQMVQINAISATQYPQTMGLNGDEMIAKTLLSKKPELADKLSEEELVQLIGDIASESAQMNEVLRVLEEHNILKAYRNGSMRFSMTEEGEKAFQLMGRSCKSKHNAANGDMHIPNAA